MGFTRAELLVVVAVMAVGIAMLVPYLAPAAKRSRAEADLARCQDNLRAIGVGLLAYAQDNGGTLPVSPTLENPHTEFLSCVATPKYIRDPQLFYCPSELRPTLSFSDTNVKAGIIGYYYYSAAQASTDENLSKFLRTGLSWPRELTTRLDPKSWVMSDIWVSGDPPAHAAYKKGVNYLMLDGTVGFVTESPRHEFH